MLNFFQSIFTRLQVALKGIFARRAEIFAALGRFMRNLGLLYRKNRKTIWIILLVLVVAYVLFSVFYKEKHEEPLPVVATKTVGLRNVNVYGEYVGRVRAQQFVEVHARVEGFLEKMTFAEGTYVTKGQTLFVIDQRQYKATVDKAMAKLKKDQALERKALHDLERIRPLYEQNAASQLDLDNAIAAYESAVASVGMSQADLDQAQMELDYTVVRSPISGNISERHVDLGTLVGTNGKSLLATVVKSDTVLVDFSMTALDYLKSKNPRLHTDEVLIALSASAADSPEARLALSQLPKLDGCQAHTSVMLSDVDIKIFKKLGVQLTCEAVYEHSHLYH